MLVAIDSMTSRQPLVGSQASACSSGRPNASWIILPPMKASRPKAIQFLATEVGYTGGATEHPTYADVCSHTTGHAEAVRLEYDPGVISYEELLAHFFRLHDPTQLDRQGPDIGDQYRSAVFFHDRAQREAALAAIAELTASRVFTRPVVTQVVPAAEWWRAEEYHQRYLEKRAGGSSVRRPATSAP